MSQEAVYITTPIYYVNDVPHLGHAYTTLAADVLARFWRLDGAEVKFVTGTDEHGQKIAAAAEQAGLSPQAHVDKMAESFRQMTAQMGCEPDDFVRTTQGRHRESAQALWARLVDAGDIYQGIYAGWYAVRDEAYYDADEVVDGLAPTGAPVAWVEEPCYFFRLSRWQEPLLRFYADNPDFIGPVSRKNEVLRFVERGLTDLCVSRSTCSWGVPVPNADGHVMYVWIEALSNYITALGYPKSASDASFTKFWSNSLHIVGKDILRFHGVYWPAFLMAAGLTPPRRLYAHGWWTNEGEKISKSLGNTIDPIHMIQKFGLDPVRYFLMRAIPFGADGDFSVSALVHRINGDLANDLGNLVQRVLAFVQKNAEGKIPVPGAFEEPDHALQNWAQDLPSVLRPFIKEQAIHRYLEHVWSGIGLCNQYMDQMAPWSLKKSAQARDQERLGTVLYVLIDVMRQIALFLQPIMPQSARRMLDFVGVSDGARAFKDQLLTSRPGTSLPAPTGLFPRIENG